MNLIPSVIFSPRLKKEDLKLVGKLLKKNKCLKDFAKALKQDDSEEESSGKAGIMYGLKLGASGKIKYSPGNGRRPICKGSDVAAYYLDTSAFEGWVDPSEAESKSIWSTRIETPDIAYVLARIVIAPVAAKFNPREVAFNDSTILFVPSDEWKSFPWDIYLNSAMVRFIHHTVLRASVLLRRRCVIYNRTLEVLPVPEQLMSKSSELMPISNEMGRLGERIKNRWILIDNAIEKANKKMLVHHSLDFSTWTEPLEGSLTIRKNGKDHVLTTTDEEGQLSLMFLKGEYELLNVVKYLLEDEEEVNAKMLQSLKMPDNYEEISQMMDDALNPQSPEIVKFKDLMDKADDIVEEAFGLSKAERQYIKNRLAEFPLSKLEPRYPWTPGAHHQKPGHMQQIDLLKKIILFSVV